MRSLLCMLFPLFALAGSATADEVDPTTIMLARVAGTMNVSFEPQSQNGRLIGCNFVFDAIHQDWKYRAGAFIKISGSFGVMGPDKNFAAIQKIVVNTMNFSKLPLTVDPSPPSRIYMRDDAYRSNLASLVKSYGSDTPGSLFAVYHLNPSFDILIGALEKGELIVGFNQFDGLTDIEIPVSLDVVSVDIEGNRKRSPEAIKKFATCLRALSDG